MKKCQGVNRYWYLFAQHPMDTLAFLTVLCVPRTYMLQECNYLFSLLMYVLQA